MNCGGTFSKGHLAVCPAKDTSYSSCKFKGNLTRICKPRRKNVDIVNTYNVDKTDFNPSDHPDVNMDHVHLYFLPCQQTTEIKFAIAD